MKAKLFFVVILLVLASCTKQPEVFQILGKVDKLDRAQVKLRGYIDGNMADIDSTISQNGRFIFTGSVPIPAQYHIKIDGINEPVYFFIENSKIRISLNKQEPSKAVIKGSKQEAKFQRFIAINKERFQNQMDSLESLPWK